MAYGASHKPLGGTNDNEHRWPDDSPGGGRGLEDPSGQPVSPLRETGDHFLPYPGRRAPVPAVRPEQVRRPVQANQEGSRDDRRPELRAER